MQDDLVFATFSSCRGRRIPGTGRFVFLYPLAQYGPDPGTEGPGMEPAIVCEWRVIWRGRREMPLLVGSVKSVSVSAMIC